MQQRRLRLGDVLDDYCPRERRITNHAVVAMIDDQVKQTRCTTCNADHEYKQARIPSQRRKKLAPDSPDEPVETVLRPRADDAGPADEGFDPETESPSAPAMEAADGAAEGESVEEPDVPVPDDEGPVHRRLIRATLPRPEGQMPERKEPEFTIRQPGFRDGQRNGGQRRGGGGGGGRRPMHGPGAGDAQPTRFGGPRGGQGQSQGPRHGGGPGYRPTGNRQDGQPGGARGPRGPGGPGGGGRGGRRRGR